MATPGDTEAVVDIGKHIHFVLPFQELDIDTYFIHFEKIAVSPKWPEVIWTVLLKKCVNWKGLRNLFSPFC